MSVQRDEMRWRTRALRQVAELEKRIAALKGRGYCGAGFSWEWPESLANTRRQIEGLAEHTGRERAWRQIVASVRLEQLAENVYMAGLCADGDCRHPWRKQAS